MTWKRVPLADLADIQGGIQKQPKRAPRNNSFPFLRVANVTAKGLDLSDVHAIELFGDELPRLRLRRGDLLVVEGNGSASQIGRAAVWDGSIADCVHQNHLIRVRAREGLLPRYLGLLWNSPAVREELTSVSSSSSGLHTLSVAKLKRLVLPVPPIGEQQRIVEILEDHLSRLDAANSSVARARRRGDVLVKAILTDLIPDVERYPGDWVRSTVGLAGRIGLGRQRHPDWHTGPNMRPYLKVANVFEDRIDTSVLMEMHWPDDTFERFRLRPGDILLNEGQTPDLLGRPALYRGSPPEVAFTNSLIRFVAGTSVLPEFALLVFRRHMHAGRFKRESRITTNIAHLSAARLKDVEFPIPPIEEQRRIIDVASQRLDAVEALSAHAGIVERRSGVMRRAVLAAAFEGKLTGRHTDAEMIEELTDV